MRTAGTEQAKSLFPNDECKFTVEAIIAHKACSNHLALGQEMYTVDIAHNVCPDVCVTMLAQSKVLPIKLTLPTDLKTVPS